MTRLRSTIILGIIPLFAYCQDPKNAGGKVSPEPQTPGVSNPLRNADIIAMKKAGLGDALVIAKVAATPSRFNLEPAEMVRLHRGGLSDSVIAAMLKKVSSQTPGAKIVRMPNSAGWNGALGPRQTLNTLFRGGGAAAVHTDEMGIGNGYNSATGEKGAQCVVYNPLVPNQLYSVAGSTAGANTTYSLQQVTSFEQLTTLLQIDAKASLGFGLFSGDVAVSSLSSGFFSRFNNYVYMDVLVQNPTEMLISTTLTPAALNYAQQGIVNFVSSCGDQFVYARQTGGEFTALIQFSTDTDAEQSQVATQINASIGLFASTSASFSQAMNSLKTISNLSVHIVRSGGLGALPDIDAVKNAALSFPTQVSGPGSAPRLYALLTEPYFNVDNLPTNISDFGSVQNEANVLSTYGAWLTTAYKIRGELQYISTHRDQFVFSPSTLIDTDWQSNEVTIAGIIQKASGCKNSPGTCDPPTITPQFIDTSVFVRQNTPPVATPQPPQYTFQWVRNDPSGRPYAQVFQVPRGRISLMGYNNSSGSLFLSDLTAQVYDVKYECTNGGPISFGPSPVNVCTIVQANTQIVNDGRGFNWNSDFPIPGAPPNNLVAQWTDTYTALYQVYKQVCVSGCSASPANQ